MKKLNIIGYFFLNCFLIFAVPELAGQLVFESHTIAGEEIFLKNPKMVRSTDLDKDGDKDIVAISEESDKIVWYENNGDQMFTFHLIEERENGASFIYLIDFDNDLDTDIIATVRYQLNPNTGLGGVVWYENDGFQNFRSHVLNDQMGNARNVSPSDFDNDSDLDIFCVFSVRKFGVLINDGNNNFSFTVIDNHAYGVDHVSPVDLDEDGDVDIVAHTDVEIDNMNILSYGEIFWYENINNQYSNRHSLMDNLWSTGPPLPVDFDRDGDIDIVCKVSPLGPSSYILFENDGQENFTMVTIYDGPELAGTKGINIVDWDNDSDLDILLWDAYNGEIYWLENDGSQNFEFHTFALLNLVNGTSIFYDDMDGDQDVDFLSASVPAFNQDKVTWHENIGEGNFVDHELNNRAYMAKSVYAVDLDNDGLVDVLSSSIDHKITWYKNYDNQHFFNKYTIISEGWPWFMLPIDFDQEGDIDILVADPGTDEVIWYENDDMIGFTQHIIATEEDLVQSVFPIDIDNDSDLDVIAAVTGERKITWYENDGQQTFFPHLVKDGVHAMCVKAIDLDRDNDIDIIAGIYERVSWFENDGYQNFTEHIIESGLREAYSVNVIDLDQDGDCDIIAIIYTDNKLMWYENDGQQNFDIHVISNSVIGGRCVYSIDLDRDNYIDILTASHQDDMISWFKNDGNQNFTRNIISNTANGAWFVYAKDLDNDNDLDVLSASEWDHKIAWYENLGSLSIHANLTVLDFGEVLIKASKDSTIVLTNSGTEDLLIEKISLNKKIFKLKSPVSLPVAISAGERKNIIITFTPTGTIQYDDTLSIVTNDVQQEIQVYLRGYGRWPASPSIYANMTLLDFGKVWIKSSKDSTIVLTNTGTEELLIENISLTDTIFKVKSPVNLPLAISAKETKNIVITITPTDTIQYDDTLSIVTNDVQKEIQVYLRGSGRLKVYPNQFGLYQNYPNPFNSGTNIRYDVKEPARIKLVIYNNLGQIVKVLMDKWQESDTYLIKWDGKDQKGVLQSSGLYFLRMKAGDFKQTKKLILIR